MGWQSCREDSQNLIGEVVIINPKEKTVHELHELVHELHEFSQTILKLTY